MPETLSVALAFLSVVAIFLVGRHQSQKRRRRGLPYPPGPKPLPILKNILDIPANRPWIRYKEWSSTHGDLIHMEALGIHVVVINSTEIAYELLDKRSKVYSDRPPVPMAELMDWDFTLPLLPYGEKWRAQRQIFHQKFRSQSALAYRPMQLDKIHDYLRRLIESPQDFEALNRDLSAAIIMKSVYGYEIKPRDDPLVEAAERGVAMLAIATLPGAMLVNILPILRYVPEWFPGAGFQRFASTCRKLVRQVKDAPLEFVKTNLNTAAAAPCIVSDLLETMEGDKEEFIKELAASAFAAGADTTVSSTLSVVLSMVLYPEAARKARDEIDEVVGTSRLPTYDDRPALPYVEAYYREIMRWHPVTPLGVPHSTIEDDVYNGYFIPKGAIVMGNIWAMTHNEKKYPEPDKFNPDRFFDADGKLNDDETIISFGFGRRVCVGQHLADATIWATLVSLLAVFDITKAKDSYGNDIEVDGKYVDALINHPLSFKCSITPRSKEARRLILETADSV